MQPRNLFDLTGKVAVVTGASSGLGRRSAMVLAAAGAQVVAVARRADALADLANELGDACAPVVADLADRGDWADCAKRVAAPFGDPDILVHAAGINTRQEADDITLEAWDTTLDLNLAAPFFLAQALVPAMRKRGWGRIVNLSLIHI